MNDRMPDATRTYRLTRAAALAVASLAVAFASAPTTHAAGPDVAGAFQNAVPLDTPADAVGTFAMPGPIDGSLSLGRAPSTDAAPAIDDNGPAISTGAGPRRVWTTDRYGRPRTTYNRGEIVVFWVQLYNPGRTYARYPLELWVDDHIRCFTTPCDGGPQRLFAGTVWLRPGYTVYYRFARSEASDKVGAWDYYATDPDGRFHVVTAFNLR